MSADTGGGDGGHPTLCGRASQSGFEYADHGVELAFNRRRIDDRLDDQRAIVRNMPRHARERIAGGRTERKVLAARADVADMQLPETIAEFAQHQDGGCHSRIDLSRMPEV